MKNIFYRITYTLGDKTRTLYGHVATSYFQTISEMQAFGINLFTTELLSKDELDADPNSPYPVIDDVVPSSCE